MRKPKIAVLDEEQNLQEDLRSILQEKSEVSVFSTQDELLRSAASADYDCVLVKSSMARELQLRLREAGIVTPLICLSTEPSLVDAIALIKFGAVDYLKTPVMAEELSDALDAAIRQKCSGIPDRYFSMDITLGPMLDGMERELICVALQRSGGVVGGRKGAAAMLGITRTGLLYKMKRLGISRSLIASSEPESMEIVDVVTPATSTVHSEDFSSSTAT